MAAHAHLITMGLEPGLNESIRAWFKEFNFLPPLPLEAAKVDTVMGNVSFEDLLQRMIDSPYRCFILMLHGYEDGAGLYLRLANGQKRPHTEHADLQKLMDVDARVSTMSDKDRAIMGITQAHVERLLGLMRRVRAKKIDTIEFRSCNLGKNSLSLDRFRRFLGAKCAGAPNLHTYFASAPLILRPDFVKVHTHFDAKTNWETYNFPSAWKTPDLVCCFALNKLGKPESFGHMAGHVATSDLATLNTWIKAWMMPTGIHEKGNLPMHGLWIADKVVPASSPKEKPRMVPAAIALEEADTNVSIGGWGGPVVRRFIPPLSENYRKHIVYSR